MNIWITPPTYHIVIDGQLIATNENEWVIRYRNQGGEQE